MIIPLRRRALVGAVAASAALGGALVAVHYHQLDLTLSHYDARGHLVVARRIFDSLTPGWQQIGAVWLPLPHLLNALPAQIDAFYRTGASAVAISIASFAIATAAIAWTILALTGSAAAAIAGSAVFALNPNVLYLQATPMTEPLLIALSVLSVALLIRWCRGSALSGTLPWRHGASGATTGVAFALACLTRYEAWAVTASALAAAVWVRWRAGDDAATAIGRVSRVAVYPAAAVVGFAIFSRVVIGEWLVASGFFVPENPAQGEPYLALAQVAWGVRALSGAGLVAVASLGAAALVVTALADRARAVFLLPLALVATAALPWIAFVDGHPYRIRYMVPLVAAEAVCAGVLAGLWRRGRPAAALALLLLAAVELAPVDASAPMVTEAQWDRPNRVARQRVAECLTTHYRGETVMASMGSLGHYMQDLSRRGFALRDF
ncbi:MAG: phospholipid carrier-dependent glycosyltransferase, partial [Luteitalea sp.]|nr:phospholipid carrier-dependent glycosyltransferase [Luteitalea sp.]